MIKFKKSEALVKIAVKRAKKESFEKYCSSINGFSPIGQVWKKVNSFANKRTHKTNPLIETNGLVYRDAASKNNIITEHFEKNLTVDHSGLNHKIRSELLQEAHTDNTALDFNEDFTRHELQ